MKHDIIVFMGLKTCGKDYNAKPYIELGYKKVAFADPLRKMLWEIIGYTPEDYNSFKKYETFFAIKDKLFNIIPFYKNFKCKTSVRKLLQNLGSVIKTHFGEEYWSKKWAEEVLKENADTVCTDCRFDYEVKKALSLKNKGYNVTFVWCCYDKADFKNILKDKHESEALNQFIYYNQEKYGLVDGATIKENVIKQILKDFKNRTL